MTETCPDDSHDFFVAGEDYFKQLDQPSNARYDETVAYSMLVCKRCGTTKEIISRNERP